MEFVSRNIGVSVEDYIKVEDGQFELLSETQKDTLLALLGIEEKDLEDIDTDLQLRGLARTYNGFSEKDKREVVRLANFGRLVAQNV
jgi:hypothetical protein